MSQKNTVTGQAIDYKESNDNAPPSYSSPSAMFKNVLRFHADQNCSRCKGNGYIGSYKNFSGGRCFLCLPDDRWNSLLGEVILTGIDDNSGEHVCEIRRISSSTYGPSMYVVARIGLPTTNEQVFFPTVEEAQNFASKKFGI